MGQSFQFTKKIGSQIRQKRTKSRISYHTKSPILNLAAILTDSHGKCCIVGGACLTEVLEGAGSKYFVMKIPTILILRKEDAKKRY